jgi:hypothetical protein
MNKEIYSKAYRTLYLLHIEFLGKCLAQLIVNVHLLAPICWCKLDCDYN